MNKYPLFLRKLLKQRGKAIPSLFLR